MDNTTVSNTAVFMDCARKLDGRVLRLNWSATDMRGGLNLDKDFIKDKTILNRCWDYVTTYLGDKIPSPKILVDESDKDLRGDDEFIRRLMMDTIPEYIDLFIGSEGIWDLSFENALILYNKLKRVPDKIGIANGFKYALLYKQIKTDFTVLLRSANKGLVSPIYDLNPTFFTWRRTPQITRKFAMYATRPEGYNCYYFEKQFLYQIVFLYLCGEAFKDAMVRMDNCTAGILYPYMNKQTEDVIFSQVLSGRTGGMESNKFSKCLETLEKKMFENYGSDLYTVMNMEVKPHMIEIIGSCIKATLDEIKRYRPDAEYLDAFVYHLAPNRFALAVREDIKIEEILPESYTNFKKVVKPLFMDVANGLYL